jgi:hypothetical protein
MSPFEAFYGRKPPTVLDYVHGSSINSDLEQTLAERQKIINTLKENLKRSRHKMEAQANKKRKNCTFTPVIWFYCGCSLIDNKQSNVEPLRNYQNDFLVLLRLFATSALWLMSWTFRRHHGSTQ